MLILLQPDLGTSVDIVLIATAVLFVAGLSWKWLAVGARHALPLLYLLITHVSYRQARLMAFLNPDSDPLGSGFQLLQSLIAVGSGGFTGVGLMESKQKLFYLPEAHTDFIYAVICEELGFIGAILVIALFGVYGWRGLRAAFAAPDGFGRLLATRHHRDGAEPGADQFCRRARHGPDERHSAAVRQLRRIEPAGDAAGHRRAPEHFAAGHRARMAVMRGAGEPTPLSAGTGGDAAVKLLIAGGGTGGHVFPAIAIAREWMSRGKEREVVLVGTQRGLEMKLVPQAGLPLETLRVAGLKGKGGATLVEKSRDPRAGFAGRHAHSAQAQAGRRLWRRRLRRGADDAGDLDARRA